MIKKQSQFFTPAFRELLEESSVISKPHLQKAMSLPQQLLLTGCGLDTIFSEHKRLIGEIIRVSERMQTVFDRYPHFPDTAVKVVVNFFAKGKKHLSNLEVRATVTDQNRLVDVGCTINDVVGSQMYEWKICSRS